MEKQEDIFKKLREVDVRPFIKQKNKMNYLSWAVAWRLVIELFPDATYELKTFDDGMPCKMIPFVGAFVSTSVTIGGITREMTLPVLDGANKSLKETEYTYDTKYKQGVKVEAINAFDINKAQMRCLVKNLGVFGLGLDLYIGYDLPADLGLDEKDTEVSTITGKDVAKLAQQKGIEISAICNGYKKAELRDFTEEELIKAYKQLQTKPNKE